MSENKNQHSADLERIIESAQRLGVELDEAEALQWLSAIAASASHDQKVVMDQRSGVFGHKVSMLDFSSEDLDHFREIGRLVEFYDVPGKVETALALSGSVAQSKIQTYPGDADYFERVNIIAPDRPTACQMLAELIREKVEQKSQGPNYQLLQIRMGSYPQDVIRDDQTFKSGSSIEWSVEDVLAGGINLMTMDEEPLTLHWDEAAQDPGWCKLDWVVADPVRNQLVNASNMLDVTWEAPDGSITPLDGYLDSFFQEVYLEADSIPIFSKLVKHVSGDALDDYVNQLENEVKKYVSKDPNYGKAAKRMYNVFRLTGKYPEAAYIRELFDEPTTILYQVGALIRTVDESFQPGSKIDIVTITSQMDELIMAVVGATEGEKESEIVRLLLRLKGFLTQDAKRGQISPQASAARAEVINLVNNFFYEKLHGVPSIKEYIDNL